MKTGNTPNAVSQDEEEAAPQWSPVMKTGNTARWPGAGGGGRAASMEPGHEDREYPRTTDPHRVIGAPQWSPVMKTGNTSTASSRRCSSRCLNGARS